MGNRTTAAALVLAAVMVGLSTDAAAQARGGRGGGGPRWPRWRRDSAAAHENRRLRGRRSHPGTVRRPWRQCPARIYVLEYPKRNSELRDRPPGPGSRGQQCRRHPPLGGVEHSGKSRRDYVFELYALSAMVDLPADATRAQLLDAIKDIIVGKAAYVGRFRQ